MLFSEVFCATDSKSLRGKKDFMQISFSGCLDTFRNFWEWGYQVTIEKLVLLTDAIGFSLLLFRLTILRDMRL